MSTPGSIVATRQLYTVDDIAKILAEDFTDRKSIATVDVNEWGPELFRGTPGVTLSYESGDFGEPQGAYHAAVDIDVTLTDGTPGLSRPILDDVQGYVLRIHAPAIGNAEPAAIGARRATDQLMRQTLRAIRRAMAAPLRARGTIEWPGKADPDVVGTEGWTYGSLVRVRFVIASPVVDDAYTLGDSALFETQTELSTDGGASFNPSDPPYDQPVN